MKRALALFAMALCHRLAHAAPFPHNWNATDPLPFIYINTSNIKNNTTKVQNSFIDARQRMDRYDHRFPMVGALMARHKLKPYCTATLVGPRTILTASHCTQPKYKEAGILFYPGFYETAYPVQFADIEPSSSNATEFFHGYDENTWGRVPDKHIDMSDEKLVCNWAADWTILVLDKPLGETQGFMNVSRIHEADLGKDRFASIGYSNKRPDGLDEIREGYSPPGKMFYVRAPFFRKQTVQATKACASGENLVTANARGDGGDSGGPFFGYDDGHSPDQRLTLYGVVVAGARPDEEPTTEFVTSDALVQMVHEVNAAHP